MAAKHNRRSRRALTLLELILALSLSVLVLMAIGMAIDIHYRMLDVRRTNVEESQLARASLRMIADDLRSTVQNSPPDLSGLDAVSANMSGALSSLASTAGLSGQLGGTGGLAGAGGASGGAGTGAASGSAASGSAQATGGQSGQTPSGSGSTGGSQTGQSSGGSPASSGASSGASSSQAASTGGTDAEDPEQATATSAVKLYGSPSELRFDISRLPRVDQYQALMAEGNSLRAVDIPSDIKTVVYFVRSDDSAEYGSSDPSTTGMGRGLMRAELDRAVSSFAEMNGDTTSMYSGAKLVADEVTALAFQYWDGLAWTTEWDSDEMGGLPLAVEIVLTIQPTQAMTEAEIAELGAADSTLSPKEQTYRLVVHLPTAISTETRTLEAEADEVAAAEMPASEESGTTTDSGGATGGSSSGGSGGGSQTGSGQPGSGQPGMGAGGTGPGGFGTGGSDPEGGGRGGRGQEGGKGDRGGKKGGAPRGGRGGFGGGSSAPTGGGPGRAR